MLWNTLLHTVVHYFRYRRKSQVTFSAVDLEWRPAQTKDIHHYVSGNAGLYFTTVLLPLNFYSDKSYARRFFIHVYFRLSS